ncbi:hypothetical protein NDN08_002066 [Rhodosorus marinus]|uniref:Uncharacterized protein n=1 Tax=Rhodosorus marinus TaxID=101924 RepID=A0AAV8UU44_9RHOD|nr:hypothetical protein NDN08_002066 [Rhodosorus marinus]
MKFGYCLLAVALFAVGAFAYEPEKCVPGLVPGLTDGPVSGYCDSSNCTQCCNSNCELVTCNNCAGCSEQCVKQAPPQIFNVDITCNLRQGGVDCIMCNCPVEWSEGIPSCVERVLKKQLKIYVSRTPKCRLKSRLRKVNLYCGLSSSDPILPPAIEPLGFPFQCKDHRKKCIIADRSFPNVTIKLQKNCQHSGYPVCEELKTVIDTDCSTCSLDGQTEWLRKGKVEEIDNTCSEGNGKCTKYPDTCSVHFSQDKCTQKCVHNKTPWCKTCLGINATYPREPPLCVSGLDPNFYQGCYEYRR